MAALGVAVVAPGAFAVDASAELSSRPGVLRFMAVQVTLTLTSTTAVIFVLFTNMAPAVSTYMEKTI